MKPKLNKYEKRILEELLVRRYWQNTKNIAERTRISWNTAKKYLDRFYEKGWLRKKGIYWKVKLNKDD